MSDTRYTISLAMDLFESTAKNERANKAVKKVLAELFKEYLGQGEKKEPTEPALHFTSEEVELMRRGKKLLAVKSVRDRLRAAVVKPPGLTDVKRLVEKHGGKYLAESGMYGPDGMGLGHPDY